MTRAAPLRRLFFALWPDEEIRAALVDASRPALRVCDGRSVPARHLHITLAYLGQCNERNERFDRLADKKVVSPPGFELVLDRFGYWRTPQVLWVGPRQCPAGLTVLVTQIRAGLDRLGIVHDRRDFSAHVTLARKVTVKSELDAPVPVRWPVGEFVLVASVTTQKGPVYEIVRRFPAGSRHDPNRY